MEKINVKELNDNVFETIGKEWMLVCAGNKDHFNMMTASWGCLGWLWNKPVAVVFIRPERFTHGIIEENEFMTLKIYLFPRPARRRKIYSFCASAAIWIRRRKQAAAADKNDIAKSKVERNETDNGSIAFNHFVQAMFGLQTHESMKKFLDKDLLQWYGAFLQKTRLKEPGRYVVMMQECGRPQSWASF